MGAEGSLAYTLGTPVVDGERPERYSVERGRIVRSVARRDGKTVRTDMGQVREDHDLVDPHAGADRNYLRLAGRPAVPANGAGTIAVADLFSGIGAMGLGVWEAARALDIDARLVLAADSDPAPLEVLKSYMALDEGAARRADLGEVLQGTGKATVAERALLRDCPYGLDVLVAGPPCQGHSRLNNHTRHDDPRNDLYERVVRFVELRRPRLCVIENVATVKSDVRRAAATVAQRLREMQYGVDELTFALNRLGVPQLRRRHVLVATRADQPAIVLEDVLKRYAVPAPKDRTARWAIGDLAGLPDPQGIDAPSKPTVDNRRRLEYLQRHPGLLNLPDDQRPDCHRLPKQLDDGALVRHTYLSMYGRMGWDAPAQTITSGFGSMGQGRYVHPEHPRTITPHEAARLQFVPDYVPLEQVEGRGRLARMIGNVAPLKLSYAIALDFLR